MALGRGPFHSRLSGARANDWTLFGESQELSVHLPVTLERAVVRKTIEVLDDVSGVEAARLAAVLARARKSANRPVDDGACGMSGATPDLLAASN